MTGRMLFGCVLASVFLAGCGSDTSADQESTDSGTSPADRVCNPETDRLGMYWLEYQEISGTCGPIPAALVRLDGTLEATCVLAAPDVWRDGNCTLERSTMCDDGSGYILEFVGVTRQQTAGGDLITGTANAELSFASNGQTDCVSVYAITATRQ